MLRCETTLPEKNFQNWAQLARSPMVKGKKVQRPELDLDTEALAALEEARGMPHGPERTEAMKKAGILRNAADLQGIFFAKRGRPTK
jgi:hypothetical protein